MIVTDSGNILIFELCLKIARFGETKNDESVFKFRLHGQGKGFAPPYLGTDNNYEGSWTEADTADVFTVNMESGIRFAISEFDHPFVLEQAKHHGLNVIEIGERQNLKSRRTEILITNYPAVRHAKTYDPNRANAVQGNLFD